MELTAIYKLWQSPFAEQKLKPFLMSHHPREFGRVLDVGCGPGTNAGHFADTGYLGVDINPGYIRDAISRFGPRFRVADVTTMRLEPGEGFDCILVNSLLHHLSDSQVDELLAHLRTLLSPRGSIHILDLVLPTQWSLAKSLARLDRGHYPRPLRVWEQMFTRHFVTVRFQPYPLGVGAITLWQMVYFEGVSGA